MKMKSVGILLSALLICGLAPIAYSQKDKAPSVSGVWAVTIRMPDTSQTETWTLKQLGEKVTGTSKGGSADGTISGSFDKAGYLRVDQKVGDTTYKVRATMDADSMDGSITVAVAKEYLWQAKRTK
jgi:hypothetical protein